MIGEEVRKTKWF